MEQPEVIAHRGASAYAAENTLAAFDLAVDQGADMLEFDIRTTADGELVTVHDATLLRTAGDPRRVDEITAAELREATASAATPPTLDDVLSRYGADITYLIDLKEPTPAWEARVPEAIERHGLGDRAIVESFDSDSLIRLRAHDPALTLAPLCPKLHAPHDYLDMATELAAPAIAAWSGVTDAALVSAMHARGMALRVWTVDDPDEVARLTALGVDGIITNKPDVAAAVMRAPRAVRAAA
jgi:glycerophosphoryl diester phosphodiesterase